MRTFLFCSRSLLFFIQRCIRVKSYSRRTWVLVVIFYRYPEEFSSVAMSGSTCSRSFPLSFN